MPNDGKRWWRSFNHKTARPLEINMRRDGLGWMDNRLQRLLYLNSSESLVAEDLPSQDVAWLRSTLGVGRKKVRCLIVTPTQGGGLLGYEWAIVRRPRIGWQLVHIGSRIVYETPPEPLGVPIILHHQTTPFPIILQCTMDPECGFFPLLKIYFTRCEYGPERIRLFSSLQAHFLVNIMQEAIMATTPPFTKKTFVPDDLCLLIIVYCFGPYFNVSFPPPPPHSLRSRLRKQAQKVRRRRKIVLSRNVCWLGMSSFRRK